MKKFIVNTPVTVTLCIEVRARNKKEAARVADEKCDGLVEYSNGSDTIDRMGLLGSSSDETWFEDTDLCGMFLEKETTVEVSSAE